MAQQCELAQKVCQADFINFFSFYYCGIDQQIWAMIAVYVFAIFIIFRYTSIVVEEYIAEGIGKISDALGMSESLAAVTLLALANGAGDVITALVAGSAPGGVSYNVGALYGAGLFVAAMVVAICIIQQPPDKPIVYEPSIIYRDIGIYLISTIATLVFAA